MEAEYRNMLVRAEVKHLIRQHLSNLSDQLDKMARMLRGYPEDTVLAELSDALESDELLVCQMIDGYERILEDLGGDL